MSDSLKQALCCVCGALRTCRRSRNHRPENYWLTGTVDRDWHRETGDLKCSECGQVTRHAIIHSDKDSFKDHAERLTRIALGTTIDPVCNDRNAVERVRSAYRQGREANPLLKHMWLISDEDAARNAGRKYVTTHCGEQVLIPRKTKEHPQEGFAEPDEVRWDQEYEDPATGRWWVEMDCVDCFRASNERRMARRRELLKEWLTWLLVRPNQRIPDEHVDVLIAVFEATQSKRTARPEDSTR